MRTVRLSTALVFVTFLSVHGVAAQTAAPVPADASSSAPPAVTPAPDEQLPTLRPPSGSFFKSIGQDVTNFFSLDTAKVMVPFTIAGLAASHWDRAVVEDAGERMSPSTSAIGNIGGNLYAQLGAGIGTYVIGRATNKPQVALLGGDLIRAQIVSQIFVQGAKFAAERTRPDGSNDFSFPSGHTASAFATATVLQEHFGWKAGLPAYAFAGFVGASRMASNKHYLSDVLVGAGIGIAAGRTVTIRLGGEKFALGAAPTQGGAMVSFTKK
jgi:membrane-associated phospholipid phosphatase